MDTLALSPAREAPLAAFGIAVTVSVALHLGALGLVAPFAYGVAPIAVEPPRRVEVVLVEAARPSTAPEPLAIAPAAAPARAAPAMPTKPVAAPSAPHPQALRVAPVAAYAPSAEVAQASSHAEPPQEAVLAPSPSSPQQVAASAPRAPEAPLRVQEPPVLLAAPAPDHFAVPVPSSPTASSAAASGTSAVASNAGASIAGAGTGAGATAAARAAPAATAVAYLDTPPPAYPESARRDGLQGLTVVEVLVSKTGAPLDVRVAKTSGVSDLDGAAVAGVRKWRFTPATRDREPIDARITIPIRFRLDAES